MISPDLRRRAHALRPIGPLVLFLLGGAFLLLWTVRLADLAPKGSATLARPAPHGQLAANARTLVCMVRYLLEPETLPVVPASTNVLRG